METYLERMVKEGLLTGILELKPKRGARLVHEETGEGLRHKI